MVRKTKPYDPYRTWPQTRLIFGAYLTPDIIAREGESQYTAAFEDGILEFLGYAEWVERFGNGICTKAGKRLEQMFLMRLAALQLRE